MNILIFYKLMSIKINRLEEGHNSYPLVCRRPAETVSLRRRHICYRWGTPAYWSLVPRSSMFYLFEFCLKNMWNWLKALWIVSFKRVFNLSCGRVVYRVEKSKVLMEDIWEKYLDLRLSKRSLEFFKIHMWFMPLRE